MYIDDELIQIYFRHVPVSMILQNRVHFKEFPKREFERLLFCYLKEYSETECELLYQNMRNSSDDRADTGGEAGRLNVFSVLEKAVAQVLNVMDNEIRCKYSELERWRSMTRYVGEDLLTCAYTVWQSRQTGRAWDFFQWDVVLGHTNTQLNAVMERGISDNHFHLFGSAPVFPQIWLRLMNDVYLNPYVKKFREIDRKRRNMHYSFDMEYQEESLGCMVLQAALIRVVLFIYVNMRDGQKESIQIYEEKIKVLLPLLERGEKIRDAQKRIRELVNLLKAEMVMRREGELPDYALAGIEKDNINWIFAGERRLVHQILYRLLVKKEFPDELAQMFYAYLAIRTCLRGEIVQNNENIGFENFAEYQGRKKGILTDRDTKTMIRFAVHGSFRPGNLQSLELRISPRDTYIEDARQIRMYDRIIIKKGKCDLILIDQEKSIEESQFYYVYHFSKRKETGGAKLEWGSIPCRDALLRKDVRKKGKGILDLRMRMPKEAARIRGIDACSQEIGCRPEVFASTFRRLHEHITSFSHEDPVKQLRRTYHVGEDFLDIADGLRAVDEAVHFLNLTDGDRLGHATVLGISVKRWYRRKHYRILVSAQDYLDNVMWFFHKLQEFQISDCEQLQRWLCHQFDDVFFQIYVWGQEGAPAADIYNYYEAWKLRGDDPGFYQHGKFALDQTPILGSFGINGKYPEHAGSRERKEVVELYWRYHYCREARKAGKRIVEVQIPDMYVKGIEQVQKGMQKMVGSLGIGIETNPSSNLAISSIADLGEHPILKLYNKGLESEGKKDCPQLSVSINTDDKGVFHTSLENEYALMASTLETMKRKDGKSRYNRQQVYEWIENVRNMGNQQRFQNDVKTEGGNRYGHLT